MLPENFDYHLPEELIAQQPAKTRDASRLMVLDRQRRLVTHAQFREIGSWLRSGDLLVVNDTRVIPARLLGVKETGGRIEVFLVRRLAGGEQDWECLTKASKTPKPGTRLRFEEGLEAEVLSGGEAPFRRVRFFCNEEFPETLERVGRLPLPPYIRREVEAEDRERYQTVFACQAGAVAAPTAGLHFTPQILDALRQFGVEVCPLTLHVGLGTFLPLREEQLAAERLHREDFSIPDATAESLNRAKSQGRRIMAVGTTTTRALEAAADSGGRVRSGSGMTELFIRPGYKFKVIDGLISNFHLPKSSLLMLVSAFADRELMLDAYRRAVAERYRFFSYGDCMLIY